MAQFASSLLDQDLLRNASGCYPEGFGVPFAIIHSSGTAASTTETSLDTATASIDDDAGDAVQAVPVLDVPDAQYPALLGRRELSTALRAVTRIRSSSRTSGDSRPSSRASGNVRPISRASNDLRPNSRAGGNVRPGYRSFHDRRPNSRASGDTQASSCSLAGSPPSTQMSGNLRPNSRASVNMQPSVGFAPRAMDAKVFTCGSRLSRSTPAVSRLAARSRFGFDPFPAGSSKLEVAGNTLSSSPWHF